MKTFKCITDVAQLRDHPLRDTVESLVVPVIEPADVDRVLDDLDMP